MEMKNSENLMTQCQMNNSLLLLNLFNNKIAIFSQTTEEVAEEECKWIVEVKEASEVEMVVEEEEWEVDKWVANVVATTTTVEEEVVSIIMEEEVKDNSSKKQTKAPVVQTTKQ
jgi:diphthamide synthase subunit DPH2